MRVSVRQCTVVRREYPPMRVGAYTQVVACVLRILHRLLSEEQREHVVNGTLLRCDLLSVHMCVCLPRG